ncbi:MAG TPA: NAD(+)/NADH kinase [Opitutaceae bacterium]|nr:NAD(+)/NADH kinase [Opitutaceae bacterium]
MPPFRRLAFIVNRDKPHAAALARELVDIADVAGAKVVKTTRAHRLPAGWLRGCDACCVIGGDGTLLGAVDEAARADVPIIGVNQGSLGYLTTFSADEARGQFADLLRGHYRIAKRDLLECQVGPGRRDLALNDVLIKDTVNSRLVRLEVFADGELVTDYYCDGLLFSTPTGSTAYNLSAGGPIIHPASGVIAMTPICPHTLSNRTIIFRDAVKLKVYNRTADSRLLVAMDGQRNVVVTDGKPVEVSMARRQIGLVQGRRYSHFSVMRAKLKWSGGFADRK